MIHIWECLEIKWLNLINLVSVWLDIYDIFDVKIL